jgi:type IV pilus assembly protein PilW
MSHHKHPQHQKQCGLSVVELLVAVVIGMLLLTGVLQVFLASKQTYSSNEAASRLQENGRFALEFIAQSARHAGYVEPANTTASKPAPIAAPSAAACNTPQVCSSDGAGNASDAIGFIFQPRLLEGNVRRDCLGSVVGDANNTDLIINQFVLIPAVNAAAHSALGCRSWNINDNNWVTGATPAPLIDGIDALQIQYGLSANSSDLNSVSQYVSADRVTALNKWNDVVAIRIAVLANSVERTSPPTPARSYVLLDAAPIVIDDGRARQVFTTTIKLRNTF